MPIYRSRAKSSLGLSLWHLFLIFLGPSSSGQERLQCLPLPQKKSWIRIWVHAWTWDFFLMGRGLVGEHLDLVFWDKNKKLRRSHVHIAHIEDPLVVENWWRYMYHYDNVIMPLPGQNVQMLPNFQPVFRINRSCNRFPDTGLFVLYSRKYQLAKDLIGGKWHLSKSLTLR